MLYVPRHLPNKLEYKVFCCISVHYQSRMTSNGIAITPSHPPTVQAGQYEVGWVSFVDVAVGGIVPPPIRPPIRVNHLPESLSGPCR